MLHVATCRLRTQLRADALWLPRAALFVGCKRFHGSAPTPLAIAPHVKLPAESLQPITRLSHWQLFKSVLAKPRQEKVENAKKDGERAKFDPVALQRLIKLARPEIVPLSVAIGTLGLTTGISLLFPYAIGRILDVAIDPATVYSPAAISGALLGLFVVQSALIALRAGLLSISGERIAAQMRKDLFKCILSQEVGWFDGQRTGDIINRLSSDTVLVQKALTNNIANGLRAMAMSVGGTCMLFYLSPPLAALSLSLIPPVAVAGMYYGRYLQGQQKVVQETLGKTMEVAEELVGSIRTVRSFARERQEAARFSGRVNEAYHQAKEIGVVAAYFDGAVHMAANISLVAVLWYGGSQVMTGAMSAGDLTAFLMYSLYTGFSISGLSGVYTELKRASGAASRIFDVMDRRPSMPLAAAADNWADDDAIISGTGMTRRQKTAAHPVLTPAHLPTKRIDNFTGAISFEDVEFAYPSRPDITVLKGFRLDIPAGKTIALVGTSGSGKSTLGALMARLYDVTGGAVRVDGVDVRAVDPLWLRTVIGSVSQEPTLFAQSIRSNILYGNPDASNEEVIAASQQANAHEFIAGFPDGYETVVGERGVQLSGGQKQRVAIARAILKQPKILILDEATSALDAESEAAILSAIDNITKGRTVITIAHRLSTMKRADLVAVLGDGKIIETGTFTELYNNPTSAFRALIQRQMLH